MDIPAGVDDGQSVRVREQGSAGSNGGPNGDLLVAVSIRPHPLFKREGTQTGATFRLRGKGIPFVGYKSRGDQYVTVVVETPTHLTKEQKDLLRKFDEVTADSATPKRKSFFEKLKENFK